MNNTSDIMTNKRVGMLMLINAFLIVFAMLHHPEGISKDDVENSAIKWVHGSLILLLVFNAFGLSCLVECFKAKGRQTNLGMLFYYIGLGSTIGAAMISGFVQPSLAQVFLADADAFSNLSMLSSILNQSLAKLGVISFGAAGLVISPVLIADKGFSRFVGIVGCIVGVVLVVPILAGISLSVLNMTILTFPIVFWHITIGIWLAKH